MSTTPDATVAVARMMQGQVRYQVAMAIWDRAPHDEAEEGLIDAILDQAQDGRDFLLNSLDVDLGLNRAPALAVADAIENANWFTE